MTTLTVNKPIIVRHYIDVNDAYTYVNYSVGYRYIIGDNTQYDAAYKIIYYGKAFVGEDGYINIDITDVVKNHAFRHEYDYELSTQKFVPENLNTAINSIHYPLENTNQFRTSVFSIADSDNNEWSVEVGITALFFPEFYGDENIPNPYDNMSGIIAQINYTGILPRIPLVYSDNYYIGLESIVGENSGALSNVVTLDTDTIGSCYLSYYGYGNYSNSYSLSTFWNKFASDVNIIEGGNTRPQPNEIDAGGADSNYPYMVGPGASLTINTVKDTIYYGDQKVMAIDGCPEKYYVSWTTPFGEWQSQPLKTVAFIENADNLNINTTYRVMNNIMNRSIATFNCRTLALTPGEYKLFNTLIYAPYITLYDVQKDKSYYCVCDSSSMSVRDKSKNQKTMEFTLRQINKTIN